MSTILTAVDDNPVAERVVATAVALAGLLGDRVELLHVRETASDRLATDGPFARLPVRQPVGDPPAVIVTASTDSAVSLVVIGARRHGSGAMPVGHVARAIVERADKPVVVVPPASADRPVRLERALIPLEGSEASTRCVSGPLAALAAAGVELVPVHVFGNGTSPAFWDQAAHAHDSFASSFARRWCTPAAGPLRLLRGTAGDAVLDAVDREHADLIVLGWSRRLVPGRAPVVRSVLCRSEVPVMLVPTHHNTGRHDSDT